MFLQKHLQPCYGIRTVHIKEQKQIMIFTKKWKSLWIWIFCVHMLIEQWIWIASLSADKKEPFGIFLFNTAGYNTVACFKCFSFSGGGLVTSYSGKFGEILFKQRQVRCKKQHILPPQAATSSGFICFADYAVTSRRPSEPRHPDRAFKSLLCK